MSLNLAALHECLDDMPMAVTVIELVLDDAGQPIDWIFRFVNPALTRLINVPAERLLNRRFYREVFTFVNSKKWLDYYYRASYQGEELQLHEYSPEISKYLEMKCFPWKEKGYCGIILTEETRARQLQYRLDHLVHLAHYDAATNVQNRNSYESFCAHFAECHGSEVYLMPDADRCELWDLGAMLQPIKGVAAPADAAAAQSTAFGAGPSANQSAGQDAAQGATVRGSTVGVFFVDVNDLKHVNDTFGHESGTFLIRMVSDKIKEELAGYNFQLFRIGGDEFVVIMLGIAQEQLSALEQRLKAAMVNDTVQHLPQVLAAVGSAWHTCVQSLEGLVAAADQRMYEHKRYLKATLKPRQT